MSIPQPATQVANEIFANVRGRSGVMFELNGSTIFIDFATEAPEANERFPFADTGVRVDCQNPTTRSGCAIFPFQAVKAKFHGHGSVVRVVMNLRTKQVTLLWTKTPPASKPKASKPTAPTKVEPKAPLPGGSPVPVAIPQAVSQPAAEPESGSVKDGKAKTDSLRTTWYRQKYGTRIQVGTKRTGVAPTPKPKARREFVGLSGLKEALAGAGLRP